MGYYLKKPIPIEAQVQNKSFTVDTLEGVMKGNPGDYLVTGVANEKYPVAKNIFEQSYFEISESRYRELKSDLNGGERTSVGYSEPTFLEALHKYRRDTTQRLHRLFKEIGFKLCEANQIQKWGNNVWGYKYFHINYDPIKPIRVRYIPIQSTIIDRKAERASERQYTNNSDAEVIQTYTYERGIECSLTTSERNMAGLSVSNAFTIGTGESAAVKVENTTEITVTAEFERGKEETRTDSKTETDSAQITIPPRTNIELHQQRFSATIEQVDEVHLEFDISFDFHNHKNGNVPGIYWNKDYKKHGTSARRIMRANSFSDFRSILRGLNPRYPSFTKNYLTNQKIVNLLKEIRDKSVFVTKETTIFNEGSYGAVVVNQK